MNRALALGITWGDGRGRRAFAVWTVVAALMLGVSASPETQRAAADATSRLLSVIVREVPNSGDAPEGQVTALGGSVGRHIGIIDGFVATIPANRLDDLRSHQMVHSVSLDRRVTMLHNVGGYDPEADMGSLSNVAKVIGADTVWQKGITGQGVDVALIDTGVVPVQGLTSPGKIVNGPDLSFESQYAEVRYLDTYGHGTHMAGIIAGRDESTPGRHGREDPHVFSGIAPGARIINVKVGNFSGASDVSQILAAIDWVVQNRNKHGLNIRVLNLSFGTDGIQDYRVDPLAYAVEVAWRKGIFVAAAAGNSGFGDAKLNNPAYDPFVAAVGATDPRGTINPTDDIVPDFTQRGDGTRNPDFVAPGQSILGLRAPGSMIDEENPGAVVGDRFFKGSGTSQAAAIVSGAAALLLEQRPGTSPDQLKKLLADSATKLPDGDPVAQGAGLIDLRKASSMPVAAEAVATQTHLLSSGTGTLEGARGSGHVADYFDADGDGALDELVLQGEVDIFGKAWNGSVWAAAAASESSWSGGSWNGTQWTGDSFSESSWAGPAWSGRQWSNNAWSGRQWSSEGWSGRQWSGRQWSGRQWSSDLWSGRQWSGRQWSGRQWSGRQWSSGFWAGDGWQ